MAALRDWTGSWQHVAIGTNFDGFTDPADDCADASKLPRVRDMLQEHALSPPEMEAVLGGNARRVLRDGRR